jgi:hypothetical protein
MRFTLVCLCLVGGCAGTGNDCASDAYQLGERDGVLRSYEGSRHAARCGAGFNEARYREGYAEAASRRPIPLW